MAEPDDRQLIESFRRTFLHGGAADGGSAILLNHLLSPGSYMNAPVAQLPPSCAPHQVSTGNHFMTSAYAASPPVQPMASMYPAGSNWQPWAGWPPQSYDSSFPLPTGVDTCAAAATAAPATVANSEASDKAASPSVVSHSATEHKGRAAHGSCASPRRRKSLAKPPTAVVTVDDTGGAGAAAIGTPASSPSPPPPPLSTSPAASAMAHLIAEAIAPAPSGTSRSLIKSRTEQSVDRSESALAAAGRSSQSSASPSTLAIKPVVVPRATLPAAERPVSSFPPPPSLPASSNVPRDAPDAQCSALRVGDDCEVASGEHSGREGTLVAIDEDGDAFVKLSAGGRRVVVPITQLRRKVAATHEPQQAQKPLRESPSVSEPAVDGPSAGKSISGTEQTPTAMGACLEALKAWPEGAHAATIGLLEEPTPVCEDVNGLLDLTDH